MLGQISSELAQAGMNITHMRNESKGDLACTLVDVDQKAENDCCSQLAAIDGVLKVRIV